MYPPAFILLLYKQLYHKIKKYASFSKLLHYLKKHIDILTKNI